jgi:hypothetical protein
MAKEPEMYKYRYRGIIVGSVFRFLYCSEKYYVIVAMHELM